MTGVGTPKAGVFAEGAAHTVAAAIIAKSRGSDGPGPYAGQGFCYVEFGHDLVGRVEVDFLSGPKPTSAFRAPSAEGAADKRAFGSSRIRRWFSPASS